jgi:hypothetical protein
LGVARVFIGEPTLALSSPFLCLIGERIHSRDFVLFRHASPFHVLFFLDFCGASFAQKD